MSDSPIASLRGERSPTRFQPTHPADPWWFSLFLLVIVLGLLGGFVPELLHRPGDPALRLPLMHLHAVVFAGWMVLLTCQILLVRAGRTALHRRLGLLGLAWAPFMVVVGVATACLSHRSRYGTPYWDTGFFAIQFIDMVAFSLLAWQGLRMRHDPPAHKRLMLLATLATSNAGWGRMLGPSVAGVLGTGFAGTWVIDFSVITLMLVAFLAYDAITRGRPHPVVVRGFLLMSVLGLVACWSYPQPWWQSVSGRMLAP